MNTTACTRCEAVLESDMRFCEQCGMAVPLPTSAPPPMSAKPFIPSPVSEEMPRPNQARRIGVMAAVVVSLAVLAFAGWRLETHRTAVAVAPQAKVETKAAINPASTVPQAEAKAAATPPDTPTEKNAAKNDNAKAPGITARQAPLVAEARVPRATAKAEQPSEPVAIPQPERPVNEPAAVAAQPSANEQPATAPEEIVPAKPETKPAAPANPMPTEIAPTRATAAEPAYTGPLTGSFAYSGPPIIQNGEVVFEGLPPGSLQLAYDVNAWDGRVERSEGGRQRIVMRSKKPGTQKKCVVRWNATR